MEQARDARPQSTELIFAASVFVTQLVSAAQSVYQLIDRTGGGAGFTGQTALIALAKALSAFVFAYIVLRGFVLFRAIGATRPGLDALRDDGRFSSLPYILPFMAYGGLYVIMGVISFSVASVLTVQLAAHLFIGGVLMGAAGFASDELRKILSGGERKAASSRMNYPVVIYYVAILVMVLVGVGWLLRLLGFYLIASNDLQRRTYLYNGLEMILPICCAYTLVRVSGLVSGVLANVQGTSSSKLWQHVPVLVRVLSIPPLLLTILRIISGIWLLSFEIGRSGWLAWVAGDAALDIAMVMGAATLTGAVCWLRKSLPVSRTPQNRVIGPLASLTLFVSLALLCWGPVYDLLDGGSIRSLFYSFSRAAFGYTMAALIARELALTEIPIPSTSNSEAQGILTATQHNPAPEIG